jgi:hypothetical protein
VATSLFGTTAARVMKLIDVPLLAIPVEGGAGENITSTSDAVHDQAGAVRIPVAPRHAADAASG